MTWVQRLRPFSNLLPTLILVAMVLILPPLGALVGGQPLDQYLTLPLDVRAWDPLPADPGVFAAFSAAVTVLIGALLWFARPNRPVDPRAREDTHPRASAVRGGHFPRWGLWGGLSLGAAGTAALADAGALSQPLLILGLTLLIAAHTHWRTGTSLVTQRPNFFLLLFPASALLGWLFYWINLFVQLWVYPDAGEDSVIPFLLVRTLGYATLLPALMVLRQWLGSWGALLDWCSRARPVDRTGLTQEGWWYLAAASIGLLGATLWSDWIWPLTWIAPFLLVMGMQQVSARPTLFAGALHGDWSRILIPALAALLLGLVMQGWNTLVGPAWVFHLPLVQSWRLFGLPLPAYAGLLPLGLLGVWVADQLAYPWNRRPRERLPEFPVRISVGR